MSMSDEKASEGEPEDHPSDSVYDFLYHDARRIGSFLAQFDDSGHLQAVRQSESIKKEHKRGFKLTAGAGLPLVASGNVGFEKSPHDAGSESSERTYDPLWSNARTLLDYLDEANLICRDITTARLGQFVLISGDLSVLNAGLLSKVWESPTVRDQAIANSRKNAQTQWNADPKNAALKPADRAQAEKAFLKGAETNARAMMDYLPYFPHSVQCTIKKDDISVWSTLTAEGMVGTVADLSLKHGTEIPGVWNLLGVLDALPNPISPQIQILNTGIPTHLGDLIKNFSNLGRTILGRAPSAFGMTALLIFREVSG